MDRDIEFIYEIGTLRFISRQWQRFLNPDFANLAEHHLRVIWLALIIAKHEKVKDTERVLKMALVHDIGESRAGDVDYLSRQYVERNEELGIKDMLGSTALEQEFVQLWKDYEKRDSIEAKIVKDADNLDIDIELREQTARGFRLQKDWADMRRSVHEKRFYTKTAAKLAKKLKTSKPHDWHINGRNRINAGDWKK